VQSRAGRDGKDYQDGGFAQVVITASADELKAGFVQYLHPEGLDKSAGEKNYLSESQRKLLLRWTLEAYYDRGHMQVLHATGIDKAIEELVERRVIAQPWSEKYKGTGLYKGQIGSKEKDQERMLKAAAENNATQRAKAIEARDNNLDGGAAAPGLHHQASGSRQRTRGGDRVAREKKVEPPKASEETAFLRKHRPEAEGCCDDCERPLAPYIHSPGQRRPVDCEHQKGGHHAGRLRARLTVDVGCNQGKRAEIDEFNDGLHRAGQDPMTAEESATLCKFDLAMLGRLPEDDPDFEEMQRHVDDAFNRAAIVRWPAVDDAQAAPSTTRSDRDFGEGREEAIADRRERLAAQPSRVARRQPKARAAYAAKKRQEAAAEKAKREADKARLKAAYEANKGKPRAPPAYRCNVLPPAPAPSGKRERVAVKRHDPASESMLTPYELERRRRAAKPAKRAAPPPANPAKRRRR